MRQIKLNRRLSAALVVAVFVTSCGSIDGDGDGDGVGVGEGEGVVGGDTDSAATSESSPQTEALPDTVAPGSTEPADPPSNCRESNMPLDDQGYVVIVESANVRDAPSIEANDVGDLRRGTDGIRPTGSCTAAGEEEWWEIEFETGSAWIASRLIELQPEAFDGVEVAKSSEGLPDFETPVEEAGGVGPILCDPEQLTPATLDSDLEIAENEAGGDLALVGIYKNDFNQLFSLKVEAFGPDARALALDVFDNPVCAEAVAGGELFEQGDGADSAVDRVLGETALSLEEIGLEVDDEDQAFISDLLATASASFEGGPVEAASSPARIITIDFLQNDVEDEGNLTGHFAIDPSLPYNGYDYYNIRRSQYVNGYGYSSRGTLALWVYSGGWSLLSSGAASPGRYTRSISSWAPSSGAFLLASAYKSSVKYYVYGTWRGESWSK